jgi:hypothetical protein
MAKTGDRFPFLGGYGGQVPDSQLEIQMLIVGGGGVHHGGPLLR